MKKRNENFRLKGAIIASGKTIQEFVEQCMEMPYSTFSKKINGHYDFTESEMEKISRLLDKNVTELFFEDLFAESDMERGENLS